MLPTFFWVIPRLLNSAYLLAYEDGTDRVFRNVDIPNSIAGESPGRKHTVYCLLKMRLKGDERPARSSKK